MPSRSPRPSRPLRPSLSGLLSGLLLLLALGLAAWVRGQPPEVQPTGAAGFSAARAARLRERLLEGLGPHRVGREDNARLRERLLAELRGAGLTPEVQSAFTCAPSGVCAPVHNLLARLPGRPEGRPAGGGAHAVLLLSHYDSVGAGPGASDDFNGTAVLLEVARLLREREAPLAHDVLFVVTDGEEDGLLGAHAFLQHPWAREVAAVVNIEARGTSGQSLMFETGADNAWLVALYATHVPRPATSSLAYAVYKRLPNDTDFTVLKGAGLTGLNLANIGSVAHYHTPLDRPEHSDARTLQHHGDTALELVTALAEADLAAPRPGGDAAFLDVLGAFTVHVPEAGMPWLGALALGLTLAATWMLVRRSPASPSREGHPARTWAWALGAPLALVVLGALAGLAVGALLSAAGATPSAWPAHPGWAQAALGALLLAGLLGAAELVAPRARPAAHWAGVWLLWAGAGMAVSLLAPEASLLLVLPALAAAVAALLAPLSRRRGLRLAALVGVAAAGVLLLPLLGLLYLAMGAPAFAVLGAVGGLLLTTLLPLARERSLPPPESPPGSAPGAGRVLPAWALPAGLLGLAAVLIAVAAAVPRYAPLSPQRLNLTYRLDADRRAARWGLEGDTSRVPEGWAAFRGAAKARALPWARTESPVLEAEVVELPAPVLEPIVVARRGEGRRLQLRLRSNRGAPQVALAFPPGARLSRVTVNGVEQPPPPERRRARLGGWRPVACAGTQAEGCVVGVEQEDAAPLEVWVADETAGVPEGPHARGGGAAWEDVVPSQDGDVTVVFRTVRL
jgi:hypothetical protein